MGGRAVVVAALLASAAAACGRVGFDALTQSLDAATTDGPVDSPTDAHPDGPPGATCATQIAVAQDRACAVRSDGELLCWGRNWRGELGDGTRASSTAPVAVAVAAHPQFLFAGPHHTCVQADSLQCWGDNTFGQLGDTTTTTRTTPVTVHGNHLATRGDGGEGFTCIVDQESAVWCWGDNAEGQLGDGTRVEHHEPVRVLSLPAVTAIAAGAHHVCAIDGAHQVWCWGANDQGQLGTGTTSQSDLPVLVTGFAAKSIAAGGDTTCAIETGGGAAYCWGDDGEGQVGNDAALANATTPALVALGAGEAPVSIDVSIVHACAVLADGGVRCWGRNHGRLGDGTSTLRSPTPVTVLDLTNGLQVRTGDDSTCVSTPVGTALRCWGQNDAGELGDANFIEHYQPDDGPIVQPTTFAMSGYHACGIAVSTGAVQCWGSNADGELGTGAVIAPRVPVPVTSNVKQVAISDAYSCATRLDGSLACWGGNSSGQLGDNSQVDELAPVQISATGVAEVHTGPEAACLRFSAGGVECWGYGGDGQLGDNTYAMHLVPTIVPGLVLPASSVAVGAGHACAVDGNHQVSCWGINSSGQMGTGDEVPAPAPRPTAVPLDALTVEANENSTCAQLAANHRVCWGNQEQGQLGVDRPIGIDVWAPEPVVRVDPIIAQATTPFFGCGIAPDGTLSCFGNDNSEGQLGDGTHLAHLAAAPVMNLGPATQVAGSTAHACALLRDGSVWCWGRGAAGQLGDGSSKRSALPVRAIAPCP